MRRCWLRNNAGAMRGGWLDSGAGRTGAVGTFPVPSGRAVRSVYSVARGEGWIQVPSRTECSWPSCTKYSPWECGAPARARSRGQVGAARPSPRITALSRHDRPAVPQWRVPRRDAERARPLSRVDEGAAGRGVPAGRQGDDAWARSGHHPVPMRWPSLAEPAKASPRRDRSGQDLDVSVGSVYADALAVLDQTGGLFHAYDGRQAVLPGDHRAVGHQAAHLRHQARYADEQG